MQSGDAITEMYSSLGSVKETENAFDKWDGMTAQRSWSTIGHVAVSRVICCSGVILRVLNPHAQLQAEPHGGGSPASVQQGIKGKKGQGFMVFANYRKS